MKKQNLIDILKLTIYISLIIQILTSVFNIAILSLDVFDKSFQDDIEIINEFSLWNQFDPLNKNMNIPSLENYILPFLLLYQIKDITNLELLVSRNFIVLLNFTEHAHN